MTAEQWRELYATGAVVLLAAILGGFAWARVCQALSLDNVATYCGAFFMGLVLSLPIGRILCRCHRERGKP